MHEVLLVQMTADTSFSDLMQNITIQYERNVISQRIHVMQETTMLKEVLNARNPAIRLVSVLEVKAIFSDKTLRVHNQRAYDFFKNFNQPERVEGSYKELFAFVAELEKAEQAKTQAAEDAATKVKATPPPTK
jgi:acetoin utilization deacetylase AcuC-like enzyme